MDVFRADAHGDFLARVRLELFRLSRRRPAPKDFVADE